jgi:hypothetical protein
VVPDGRSNSTRQLEIEAVPAFVIVYLPSQPEPQSEVLVKVAVSPAASAGVAVVMVPASPRTSAARIVDRRRRMTTSETRGEQGVTARY